MYNHTGCRESDDGCSRVFNLCRNTCSNDNQEEPTEQSTAPNSQAITDSKPVNARPTNISCTPVMITTTTTVSPSNTASTIRQSCSNVTVTSVILSTITKTQEMNATCPQITTVLMTTTTIAERKVPENTPCTTITSTKFIATTVLSPLQSCAPQFTNTPKLDITKSPTTSVDFESCSCNKPGVPIQGNGSSTTISARSALLGLSLVLLALVTAGWVWTCWTARKRGEININSKTNK
jgi:hypothetical protein